MTHDSLIRERDAELGVVFKKFFAPQQSPASRARTLSLVSGTDDDALLERARRADNGAKFRLLYDHGDVTGYPSQSEADLALASSLVFWAEGDGTRADSLFRRSKLMRDKWDEQRGALTYGEKTIATAVASYIPRTPRPIMDDPWRDVPPPDDADAPLESETTVDAVPDGVSGDEGPSRARARLELLWDDELDAQPDAPALVEDFAFQNGLIALIGMYETFKTFILLELAFCLAIGVDWHGRRVTRGLVIYLYAEGRHGIRKRVAALKKRYGYSGRAGICFLPRTLLVSDPARVAELLVRVSTLPEQPVAVFIDTVARNMAGNENSVEDMGRFVSGCDAIRETTGAAVFLAHHTGWEGGRSRGSTNLPGSVDTEILAERDGDRVTLTCTKQKDAAKFAPLTFDAIPMGESIVLELTAPTSSKLSENERKTLRVLQESGPLKTKAWKDAVTAEKVSPRSFFDCKKRLLALAYVKESTDGFVVTDAGRQVR